MTIKAIMAVDEAGGIGKKGTLPWPKFREDFDHFKVNTMGMAVLMGSSTWNSEGMPKPLPNRINCVASRNPDSFMLENAHRIIRGPELANETVKLYEDLNKTTDLDLFIIGGSKIIEQCWDIISEWLITRIPGKFDCDTFLDITKLENDYKLHESWKGKKEPLLFQHYLRKVQ